MAQRPSSPGLYSGNPLASDEPSALSPTGGLETGSRTPLGLAPMETGGLTPPMRSGGLDNIPSLPNITDAQFMQQAQAVANAPLHAPTVDNTPPIFYSPSTGDMVVNGFQFNQRNATKALQSQQFAAQPRRDFTLPDTVNDWRPLGPQEYASYIDSIRNPGIGKRISEAWETGWRGAGDTAIGTGMAVSELTGNRWRWGEQAHQNILREYEENAPFILGVNDAVKSPGNFLTFVAQGFTQSLPWVIETLGSMAAGAVVGGAVSGGAGAPAGAVEGFIAKEGVRRATQLALRNTIKRGAELYTERLAGRTGVALTRNEVLAGATSEADKVAVNRFFDFGERAYNLARGAPAHAGGSPFSSIGATTGSAISNYGGMAVGDIHNTILDAGGDPTTAENIARVWGWALPYAAVETMGDIIVTNPITHLFPGFENGPSHFGNAIRHGLTSMVGEGAEEGAQYFIDQEAAAEATNQPIDIQPVDLLNNIAGGMAGGLGIGAIIGGTTRKNPRAPTSTTLPGTTGPTGPTSPGPTVRQPNYIGEYPGTEDNGYNGPDDPIDMIHVPGMSPGVSLGELPPHIPTPREPIDYPGNVFSNDEPLAPNVAGLQAEPTLPPTEQDMLRNMPRAQTLQQRERDRLRAKLADPTLVPGERNNILQALEALQGGRDVDLDAAARGTPSTGSDAGLNPRVDLGPPDLSVPITNEELAGLKDEAGRAMPPGLDKTMGHSQARATNQRYPEDIWNDMANGKQVTTNELVQLRGAIAEAAAANPTESRYANVLSQLDSELARREAGPGAVAHQERAAPKENNFSDKPATQAGPVRAGPLSPVGNDGLRGRTEEPTAPASKEDLIGQLSERAKKLKKNKKRNEQRKAERARNAEQKQEDKAIEATKRHLDQPKNSVGYVMKGAGKGELSESRKAHEAEQAKKFNEKKDEDNAVQEQSTESVPVRNETSDSEKVRGSNAEGDKTAGTSKKEKPVQTSKEPISAAEEKETTGEVDQDKVDAAREFLIDRWTKLKAKNPIVSARNSVAGVFTALKKGLKLSEKTKWAKDLSRAELDALFKSLDEAKQETRQAEKKASSFGADLSAFRKEHGDKAVPEFVLGQRVEANEWLDSADAKVKAGLAKMVRDILRDNPGAIKQEVSENLATALSKVPVRQQAAFKAFMDEVDKMSPEKLAKFRALHIMDRIKQKAERVARATKTSVHVAMADLKALGRSDNPLYLYFNLKYTKTQNKGAINQSIINPPKESLPPSQVKAIVKQVQARLPEEYRFNSVHVFENIMDLFTRANDEVMTRTSDGEKISFARYINAGLQEFKRQFPELAKEHGDEVMAAAWVQEAIYGTAGIIPEYNSLIVFAENVASEKAFYETLEHEIVVHKGLRVIFKDPMERAAFLGRVMNIPGMTEKVRALLNMYPRYVNKTPWEQVEEVIAFHSMEGPKALEKLLSAPEGVDKQTRRSLWEDFKNMVMEWVDKLFGFNRPVGEELDAIVAALREHAFLGEGPDLNKVLDDLGVAPLDPRLADVIKEASTMLGVLRQALPGTEEQTREILYGTNTDNPGRAYAPVPWNEHMGAIVKSNLPLMEKLQDMARKGAGTATNEAVKKVGRVLETMGQKAMRSMLIQKTMEIMHNTIGVARSIMTKRQETRTYMQYDALTDKWRAVWGDKSPGSTKAQRDAAGSLSIVAANNRMAAATQEVIKAFPRIIVKGADGIYSINRDVFEKALEIGTLTKDQFKAGVEQFTVSGDGVRTSAGTTTLSDKVIEDGYDIYKQESRHMAESMLEMLEHTLIMLNQKNSTEVARMIKTNKLTGAEGAFADEALQRMYKLYSDIAFEGYEQGSHTSRAKQQKKARDVLAELMRTMHEAEKVKDWIDSTRVRDEKTQSPRSDDAFKWREQANPSDDVKPYVGQINWFLEKDASGKTRFERIHDLGVKDQAQYDMLGAFQGMLNSEILAKQREDDTIQSTLGNYVEFARDGEWRVFMDVVDEDGKKVHVPAPFFAVLPVSYVKSEREAKALQAKLGEDLAGTFTINDEDGNPIKVKFDPGFEKAPGTSTLAEAPNIKEFLRVNDILGIKLNATQMAEIANLIENASERKRLGLQRANTPGMNASILQNNSATMTRRAWAAAKTSQAWMLDDVFADKKNVYGDPELLKQLQDNFDIANRGAVEGQAPPVNFVRNPAAVWLAQRDLLAYANQMRYMSKHTLGKPTINIRTTKGEQKLKIEPEGQAHLNDATALRESLKRDELEVNLNDVLSKTGPLRMAAVVMQLGSIAAGIMNAFTVVTHLPWVLTASHAKTGYGAGFQFSHVVQELAAAMSQVFSPISGLDNSLKLKDLVDKAKAGNNNTGLTLEELEFMYEQTLDGLLSPQQTYSMTGGTESSITNLLVRNFAENLLKPFGAVEAGNRRVSALATYRMAKARYIAAGVSEAKLNDHSSDEYKKLINDIQQVVWNSQGDYSNVNTPKAFRGDLAKYVMLYKMFPLMTVQMLKNLPLKQTLSVLGVLFLLGGLKSEPFADDIMDIYDTLLQKLGVRHDSVELELINMLEKIMPGSSRWIMHGAIDSLALGGTMSSRVSMGDIIPGTGMFREGADFGREISNAFGPAYSANAAILDWAWTLTDFALQAAGIKPSVTSPEELIRKIPQAQLKAIGEAGMMAYTGQITDPQGRLTSDDVTAWSIFARALGLYPLEATKANDAVRLDRMHIGYMRAVRSRFILAYAQAYRTGNEAKMDSLVDQVNAWNEAAEQSGQDSMLIKNFRSAAVRAGRAASQTAIERTVASAPDYSMLKELADITNADTTTDAEDGGN